MKCSGHKAGILGVAMMLLLCGVSQLTMAEEMCEAEIPITINQAEDW